MATAKYLLGVMQKHNPDELMLTALWNRECFSKFVEYDFTDAEWDDFVDFCACEQIEWTHWFEQWQDGGRKVEPERSGEDAAA
jgi:hypothetical protein